MTFMEMTHVKEFGTWDSGGGQELDLLTLQDGRVICISEDAVVLYSDMNDLESNEAKARPTIYL
jgi:hypothetical protein